MPSDEEKEKIKKEIVEKITSLLTNSAQDGYLLLALLHITPDTVSEDTKEKIITALINGNTDELVRYLLLNIFQNLTDNEKSYWLSRVHSKIHFDPTTSENHRRSLMLLLMDFAAIAAQQTELQQHLPPAPVINLMGKYL